MARPSRTVIREDDPTYLWKFVLRLLSIIVAIVGIGTTAWVLTSSTAPAASTLKPDAEAPKYGYEVDSSTFLPWQFIALGLSAIWNIVNIVTLLARNRALHPGANVACDLLLWLGLFFTGAIAFLGSANYYTNYVRGDYSYYDYGPYGGGTYSNGTSYQYTATGTRIPGPADTQCGGFTTCEAQQQYFSSLRKKGVIVAVGASMAFVLLSVSLPLTPLDYLDPVFQPLI